jgi:hypothetical protein
VLLALVRLGDFAPAPVPFEVFAAEAIDTAREPAAPQVSPETPLPGPIVAPPKAPRGQSSRPPVASAPPRASARARAVAAARPSLQGPSIAPAEATPELTALAASAPSPPDAWSHDDATAPDTVVAVSVPSVSPAPTEAPPSWTTPGEAIDEPFPAESVPDSFAGLEPPTAPAPARLALPWPGAQADVPEPDAEPPAGPLSLPPRPDVAPPRLVSAAPLPPVPPLPLAMVPAPSALDLSWPDPPSAPAAMQASTPVPRSSDPEPAPPSPPAPVPTATQVAPSTPAEPVAVELPPRPVTARDTPSGGAVASPLGLGPGRLRIRLDAPSMRTTDRETAVVSGALVGGQPVRVVVELDEQTTVPALAGRAFATAVKLSPGINRIRVLATDAQGAEVEETVIVEYRPPATAGVTITSPLDGHVLAAGGLPVLIVQGEVTDPTLSTVWIVANDRRVMVRTTAGRFRHVLPVLEPLVRVRAETEHAGRSATVTVDATAALPAIGVLLTDWPGDTAGPATMTVTWRPNSSRLDGAAPPLPLGGIARAAEAGADFFYLLNARPGVYTLRLSHRAGATQAVRPVLSVAGTSRPLPPVTLDGSGRTVIARLLLPQGVLWEQDDWFTGQSKTGETVTKFRFPEGVSWIERLGGPGR